jgi:PKD repeat protein
MVTVTDSNAKTASMSQTVTITPLALTTSFTFSPSTPANGTAVTFTATSSGGTSPYSYAWNFGDGSTGTGATVSHTYAVPGNYTVTETVTDSNAKTATSSQVVPVHAAAQGPPISSVDFQPVHTIAGSTTFVSQVTGGTAPFTCTWNFGDLTAPQTGCDPIHTYTAAGNYTVTLTVTDSKGSTGTVTKIVRVDPAPVLTSFKFNNQIDWGAGQDFKATVLNPSTFTVTASLSITILNSGGSRVAQLTTSANIAPGATGTLTIHWDTPPMAADYTFVDNVSYTASLGTFNGKAMSVNGTAGYVAGKFNVQSPSGNNITTPPAQPAAQNSFAITLLAYIGTLAALAAVLVGAPKVWRSQAFRLGSSN